MKDIAFSFFMGATVLFSSACNDDSTASKDTHDSTAVASNANDNSTKNESTSLNSGDRDFITDVIEGNMAEIRLAQLAQQKASSAEVKQISKMLENDHTAVLSQLKDLGTRKGVTLPTEENKNGKDMYEDLNKKSGRDFDKEYCEEMVEMHEKGIKKFESKADDGNADADLKKWASEVVTKLRMHHDQLVACQNKLKK